MVIDSASIRVYFTYKSAFAKAFLQKRFGSSSSREVDSISVLQTANQMLSITMLDVNRPETNAAGIPYGCPADAFLIRVSGEDGEVFLLWDGGKKGQGRQIIIPYLLARGITELDAVIVTHPHNDHFGGIIDVLNDSRISIRRFIYSPIDDEIVCRSDDDENYQFWLELRERISGLPEVLELNEAHVGTSLQFGSGLFLDIVAVPDSEYVNSAPVISLNDCNAVIRLRYGSFTALMPGDCGEIQSEQILRSPQKSWIESVTLLKAAHHGGDASTTAEFIRECGARIVLIPCNDTVVEHRPSFVQNLHLFSWLGAKVLRADWAHEVQVVTDGNSAECITETDHYGERAWIHWNPPPSSIITTN